MEKPNLPWKKESERNCGESETSESVSSQSETDSDGQPEIIKEYPESDIQSPKVSRKVETENEDVKDSIRTLTEKLSEALMNVKAKDDLVKQHAKVAEEAVAGWEKAENEVNVLKQKLEAAANKNSALEDRVNHLDGALKECVRQLRQARDEQEQKIEEALSERTQELESAKTNLENQIVELLNQAEAARSEDLSHINESLARENLMLKHELLAQREELEIRTIERDLSTQAAETASKQHLDSIKKVAKLEAECRKLRVLSKSSSSVNDHRSTDSQSDGGERIEASCSDSWASALIAELDQFKSEKAVNKSIQPTSSIEIDLMGDFLEMERLAALPETQDETRKNESEPATEDAVCSENSMREEIEVLTRRTKELEEKLEKIEAEKAELESEVKSSKEVENTLRSELEAVVCDKLELEDKLEKMEAEKTELQISCDITKDKYEESLVCLQQAEIELEKIQKDLILANASKSEVESQLIRLEAESRTTYAKIESLEEDVRKERVLSAELRDKCRELEEEFSREREENAIKRANAEPKIKQEDIATAAGKLADCQKTIASLGKQLQSLATLEDFLIDTASIPGFSAAVSVKRTNNTENWNVSKNEAFSTRNPTESIKPVKESSAGLLAIRNGGSSSISPTSSSSSAVVSSNQGSSEKNRNGFAKFFTRSKNGIHLEI